MRGPNGVVVATACDAPSPRRRSARIGRRSDDGGSHEARPAESRSRRIHRSTRSGRRRKKPRRIVRKRSECDREIRPGRRPAGGCAAHVRASPRQDGSSRASPSRPSKEAWTTSVNSCPGAEAAAPNRSIALCSAAANHRGPSTHGFRDRVSWQRGG